MEQDSKRKIAEIRSLSPPNEDLAVGEIRIEQDQIRIQMDTRIFTDDKFPWSHDFSNKIHQANRCLVDGYDLLDAQANGHEIAAWVKGHCLLISEGAYNALTEVIRNFSEGRLVVKKAEDVQFL